MTIITGLITALRRHLWVHQTLRISDDTRIAFDLRRDPDKLLLLLISSDAVFVILHALHRYSGFFTDPQFSITKDRGFAETFQYLKEGWIVLMLSFLTFKQPNLLYPTWSLLFSYLLVDDLFMVHERQGARMAAHLELLPMWGLRALDFGELAVTAVFAATFFVLIGVAYYRSDSDTRSFSRCLLATLVALAVFGVVVDMVHVMLKPRSLSWQFVLQITEEGGEMVVMSVIVWAVFHRWRSR